MTDRSELFESALDSMTEGIALAGQDGLMAFWNTAAETISGHPRSELLGRPVRDALESLVVGGARQWTRQTDAATHPERGCQVQVHHRLGHDLSAMARVLVLRDGLGGRIGAAVVFHSTESADVLPHGDCGESMSVQASQAELEDRLETEFENIAHGHQPFGLLWITADQSHDLRRTHGARACEAMLEKVERAVANGLRPGEQVGRWGEDEFLVISHERTPEMLADHAQVLAGLARTADFRWWGDRVSLTVSIGAAQAGDSGTLKELLERAQAAMLESIHVGGNHVTHARGGHSCLPS